MAKSPVVLAFVAALALCTLGVSFEGARSAPPQHLQWDGADRTYRVYRPAGLSHERTVPLVVVLHGGFGSGEQAERSYGWDVIAQRYGFVVVYPDGLNHAWNAGTCCGTPSRSGVDDVGFLSALIRAISASDNIDTTRIAVTGMSNGAMMAYRMACESPVHLRAIGSVSGTLLVPCVRARPTRVIEIHGTADRNVPYDGGTGQGAAHVITPPIPSVVARWERIDACSPASSATSGVVTTQRAACPNGNIVELIAIAGAGHQWPGGKPPPPGMQRIAQRLGIRGPDSPSTVLDATQTLYQLFFDPN